MKFFKRLKYFLVHFRAKQKVSIKDPHDEEDTWHVYLSPLNIITALLAFVLVVFILSVTIVAFTPIMNYIPGYQGNKTRNILIENNLKLDSLENQLNLWNNYYDNLVRIMDGREPLTVASVVQDSIHSQIENVERSVLDSVLRQQMEGEGEYALNRTTQAGTSQGGLNFLAPVKGLITQKFDPRAGIMGVEVLSGANQPVVAIMDGVVVSAMWSSTEGSVIYVLHSGNMLSAYLNNSRLMKKAGDRVSAGEVIAFTGLRDDPEKGNIQFQLWYNGSPVDPENYIIF